ncbi:fibropellin-3-like [Patiria miniata]|uniref:Avidin-like n=1 Tax=Patiria miniata TaxID=46514 RepID=A0A914B3Q6_PATMI|nr:fibropellin-3-like [Patiria miniata]
MKAVVVLLLALTSCVLAADINKRVRRDLFVDWLWNSNDAPQSESHEDVRQSPTVEDEMDRNRTPKSRCQVEGIWYNHLGSEMIINATSEVGVLSGEYRTAVERKHGTAGQGPTRLIGHTSTNGDYPTFGLTVMWRNGQSVTSWTGQCHLCDGEETLHTTWILTSHIDNCDDRWMANRIGQDTFKRYELTDGPRREEDTHNPRDHARRLEQEMLDEQLDL